MPIDFINADDAVQPAPQYSQAAHVVDAREWLFISGQIPVTPEGDVPGDPLSQADQVWTNIDAQLRAVGMSKDNLVKVTVYLSSRDIIPAYREARDAYLEGRPIALTCIVTGIFDSEWLLEIEAVAAR
ncbi:MAG: RidA family protein [Pseudomonadota bacterium]